MFHFNCMNCVCAVIQRKASFCSVLLFFVSYICLHNKSLSVNPIWIEIIIGSSKLKVILKRSAETTQVLLQMLWKCKVFGFVGCCTANVERITKIERKFRKSMGACFECGSILRNIRTVSFEAFLKFSHNIILMRARCSRGGGRY